MLEQSPSVAKYEWFTSTKRLVTKFMGVSCLGAGLISSTVDSTNILLDNRIIEQSPSLLRYRIRQYHFDHAVWSMGVMGYGLFMLAAVKVFDQDEEHRV